MKYLYLILLLFPFICFAQIIPKAKQESDSLLRIIEHNEDSLISFINKAEYFYSNDNKAEYILYSDMLYKVSYAHSNKHYLSYIYYLKGKQYNFTSKYDSAGYFIDKALQVRKDYKKDSLYAIMLRVRGFEYQKENNFQKAILYYRLSIKYFINNNIIDKNIIKTILSEAYIYWIQLDLKQYKKSIDIAEKISNYIYIPNKDRAMIFMNKGSYYLYKSDYFNAYKSFLEIEKLNAIDLKTKLQSQYYLAYTFKILGDIHKSNLYYKNILLKKDYLPSQIIVDSYHNLSLNYDKKAYLDSSLLYLKICIKENRNLEYIKQSVLLYDFSQIYNKKGEKDSALFYINLSINNFIKENFLEADYTKSLILKGKILNNYESNLLYNQAKNQIINLLGEKHARTAYIFAEIGIAQFENKLYKKALEDFQQALISVDLDFNSNNVLENPECKNVLSFVNLAKTLRYKSEALEQIYIQTDSLPYLIASFETVKLLTEQVEKMLKSYPLFESKQFLLENSQKSFTRAQHLAYLCWLKTGEQKYKEDVLLLAEKSRAAILMAQIQENEFSDIAIGDSISNQMREIEQNIAYITGQINEYSQSDKYELVENLKANLFELQEQKNNLLESYKGEYGNFSYYFKQNDAMSYNELLNFTNDNQTIIEYSLCDSTLLLNILENNKHTIFEISYNKELQASLDSFATLLPSDTRLYYSSAYEKINTLSKYLYERLISPIEHLLSNKQLIFIQESKLKFIPFEALLKDDKYLIEKYAVSYMYSINATQKIKNHKHSSKQTGMIAFLPEYNYNKLDDSFPAKKHYKYLPSLTPEEEAAALLKTVDCDTFSFQHATEHDFTNNVNKYSIVHLSLHGILDSSNYQTNKMCFTATKDSLNDGIFNVCDVIPLRLNSDLIVLSGCNTGNGKIIEGEGIMSFARNFILAGSRAILMSTWELDNNSSIKLNTQFYKYLGEGYTKPEALQRSKIDFLNSSDNLHKHPYFWSGFVLIGGTENIEVPQPNWFKTSLYFLGIIALIIATLLFLKLRYGLCWKEKLKIKILK